MKGHQRLRVYRMNGSDQLAHVDDAQLPLTTSNPLWGLHSRPTYQMVMHFAMYLTLLHAPEPAVAIVLSIRGEVQLRKAADATIRKAAARDFLWPGDRLTVPAGEKPSWFSPARACASSSSLVRRSRLKPREPGHQRRSSRGPPYRRTWWTACGMSGRRREGAGQGWPSFVRGQSRPVARRDSDRRCPGGRRPAGVRLEEDRPREQVLGSTRGRRQRPRARAWRRPRITSSSPRTSPRSSAGGLCVDRHRPRRRPDRFRPIRRGRS